MKIREYAICVALVLGLSITDARAGDKVACEMPIAKFISLEKAHGWRSELIPPKVFAPRILEFTAAAGPRTTFSFEPGLVGHLGVTEAKDGQSIIFAMVISTKEGCVLAASRITEDWFLWWAGKSDKMPKLPGESDG